MALKDILIHMTDTPHCDSRLDYAIALTKATDATLTGVYAQADPKVPHSAEQDLYIVGANASIEQRRKVHRDRNSGMEEGFRVRVESANLRCHWHRGAFTSSGDVICNQMAFFAAQSDIVILGQHDAPTCEGRVPANLPQRLVLEIGRPAIVIPYAGNFSAPPKQVVVAWDGSRESVRAINDAIPVMLSANRVTIVEINPPQESKRYSYVSSIDMAAHLQRHEITAVSDTLLVDSKDNGNLLLNYCADHSADLLVMGAYGHHRFRELVLGSTTHTILQSMTLPVLVSS